MRPPTLLATFWTTAGPTRPGDGHEVSPWDIRERIAAAGSAGFRGFGFGRADVTAWSDRLGFPAIASALREQEMETVEFETLCDWWAAGDRRAASDAARHDVLTAIESIGAPHSHIKCAPDLHGDEHELEAYAEGLAGVADDAAAVGARVALESFPFADLCSPARSDDVVRAAGRDNAGVCIDVWHVERGQVGLDGVRAIPGPRIGHVELADADALPVGDLVDDCVDRRRCCGEGGFDLRGFVDAVESTGFAGAWGVEILSDQHRALGLRDAVERAFNSAVDACF